MISENHEMGRMSSLGGADQPFRFARVTGVSYRLSRCLSLLSKIQHPTTFLLVPSSLDRPPVGCLSLDFFSVYFDLMVVFAARSEGSRG